MDTFAMTNTLKSLLVTLAIGLWLYWLWTRRSLYRFAFNYPGYYGSPILGILTKVRKTTDMLSVFGKLFEECKRYTICVWLGLFPILLTSDPDIIEKVLSSPDLINKAKTLYTPVDFLFMDGIVSSRAEKWQHNRKFLNPSFSHKVLKSLLPIFHKTKRNTQLKFDSMVGTGENKLCIILQQLSMEITFETTMGKVFNENDGTHLDFIKNFSFLLDTSMYLALFSLFNLQGIFKFHRSFNRAIKKMNRYIETIFVNKLQQYQEKKEPQSEETDKNVLSIKKTPNIFIDQAVQIYQKQQFTWTDVIAESMTIFGASYETTANSLFSSLVMLAMHSDIQEKLYEEIENVFPEKNFQMEFEHMEQLPYLDMIINETLRLAPPITLFGRHVVKDTQLTKDLCLPKDLQIAIDIYHLHRRTDIWGPNANKFNPDNFLPENFKDKHSHAFIPFSKGIRNCIGWRYALFFLKVMLAGFVRNFRFTTTFKFEDIELVNRGAINYMVEPGIAIHRR